MLKTNRLYQYLSESQWGWRARRANEYLSEPCHLRGSRGRGKPSPLVEWFWRLAAYSIFEKKTNQSSTHLEARGLGGENKKRRKKYAIRADLNTREEINSIRDPVEALI